MTHKQWKWQALNIRYRLFQTTTTTNIKLYITIPRALVIACAQKLKLKAFSLCSISFTLDSGFFYWINSIHLCFFFCYAASIFGTLVSHPYPVKSVWVILCLYLCALRAIYKMYEKIKKNSTTENRFLSKCILSIPWTNKLTHRECIVVVHFVRLFICFVCLFQTHSSRFRIHSRVHTHTHFKYLRSKRRWKMFRNTPKNLCTQNLFVVSPLIKAISQRNKMLMCNENF